MFVSAVGDKRAVGVAGTALEIVACRGRQTGNRAQRETAGTGRRNRGRPDATRPDSVDTRPHAPTAPGMSRGDDVECSGSV